MGQFAGFVGSCVDVTERKDVEMKLRADRAELAKLSRAQRY
jgi:hypothetical protein